MAVKAIPDGYASVTPYLIIRGASQAIDYYKTVFGAAELFRIPGPDGKLGHAEIRIGNSVIMLADEVPAMDILGPQSLGGSAVGILLYVENVDKVFAQAIAAGGRQDKPLQNQFYGDRSGTIIDPFGHKWTVATHVEDVSPEEMNRRLAAMSQGQG
jgi:PhnB protein